ncbi:Harbinger transposase-derived nuclease domain [Phytophthora cactorum]|nr:Harbinger transposase-derived nuclease domain [Phytophthora cactorum]
MLESSDVPVTFNERRYGRSALAQRVYANLDKDLREARSEVYAQTLLTIRGASKHTGENSVQSGGGADHDFDGVRVCAHLVKVSRTSGRGGTPCGSREPLLKNTFRFIDGENLRSVVCQVMQPSNADLQNAKHNRWFHPGFVTGTICFAADGCIIWCKHNCPGSWNDSDISLGFRMKLIEPKSCPGSRMNVVTDSAFPCSSEITGRILTPLKDKDIDRILPSLRSSERTLQSHRCVTITSVCQAAEWGIGIIQKGYSRLDILLPYDPNFAAFASITIKSSYVRFRTTVAWWMEVLTDEVDVHCVDSSVKNR